MKDCWYRIKQISIANFVDLLGSSSLETNDGENLVSVHYQKKELLFFLCLLVCRKWARYSIDIRRVEGNVLGAEIEIYMLFLVEVVLNSKYGNIRNMLISAHDAVEAHTSAVSIA